MYCCFTDTKKNKNKQKRANELLFLQVRAVARGGGWNREGVVLHQANHGSTRERKRRFARRFQ